MTQFNGFPREILDFLCELHFNNTTENLPQNKVRYKALITEPLHLLHNEINPVATIISDNIETKPSRSISGMYNDMRFTKGIPLKTYMYLRFRQMQTETDMLGLYFDMGIEGYSYGIRIYKQTSAGMAAIRKMAIEKQPEFTISLSNIKKLGAKLVGASYKKDHYPDIVDLELNTFLNFRSFYICFNRKINENLFCHKLVGEIEEGLLKLKEFYTLLKDGCN